MNVDEVEVIVPGIDYVPELGRRQPPLFTVGYKGLRWTFYSPPGFSPTRHDVVSEGTDWNEPCEMDVIDEPVRVLHIHSTSSISRTFVPKELLPYIEALLKLHA